jgi:sugar/nucleoside kinase (ribokinase family)
MSILCSGSFVADILVPDLPSIGPPGSLTYAPRGIHLSPGGHSSNVAINLTQLGAKNIHAVGSIGKDEMGKFLIDQLRNRGVTPHPEIHEDSTTAKNVALLVRGEDRRYIAELTANSLLTTEHLIKFIEKSKPDILYQGTLGGLPFIEDDLPEVLRKNSANNAINFIDVIMPTNGWEYLNPAYSHIDIFHANLLEASSLTGETSPKKAVTHLVETGIKLTIISDAQRGVIAATEDHILEMPAFEVTQIDPTGAGDALSAGVISYIQKNKVQFNRLTEPDVLIDLLLEGQAAGAVCVTGLGATTSVTRKNVKNILEQQKARVKNSTRMKKL